MHGTKSIEKKNTAAKKEKQQNNTHESIAICCMNIQFKMLNTNDLFPEIQSFF